MARQDKKEAAAAVILKNPEVEKQLGLLRDAADIGVKTAGKGLIIFYERSTRVGEIVKEIFFLLTGVSILYAGLFAKRADLFTIWNVVAQLENGIVGRIIVIIGGLGLFSYGLTRMWGTLRLTEVLEKKEKFKQKKLTE